MKNFTLGEIADKNNILLDDNRDFVVKRIGGVNDNLPDSLSFINSSKYLPQAEKSVIPVFITKKEFPVEGKINLFVENPDVAIIQCSRLFAESVGDEYGHIHGSAFIADDVQLENTVVIGPKVVIERGVKIGAGTKILSGSVIMQGAEIGMDSLIYPNVTIYPNCKLGDRVIVHASTVIGSDGYGFYSHEGVHVKIPQIGGVRIGNDVEIGANCAIDRGRFTDTIIEKGTKLDNLVHVAHNVRIGSYCLLAAQTGIAGSTELGSYVSMGGQSSITGHVKITDGVTLMGKSAITKSIAKKELLAGFPARPVKIWRKAMAALYRTADVRKKSYENE